MKKPTQPPSALEQLALEYLWANGPSTAERVRDGLARRHAMKEATARTILRRLEAKGYARHVEQGRTFIYSCTVQPRNVAMESLRRIVDRFCGGSVEALVVGMVEQEMVDPAELMALAGRLEKEAKKKGRKSR
jgi:predicted transcriptional regulator